MNDGDQRVLEYFKMFSRKFKKSSLLHCVVQFTVTSKHLLQTEIKISYISLSDQAEYISPMNHRNNRVLDRGGWGCHQAK